MKKILLAIGFILFASGQAFYVGIVLSGTL
jgi:hypothetical protein